MLKMFCLFLVLTKGFFVPVVVLLRDLQLLRQDLCQIPLPPKESLLMRIIAVFAVWKRTIAVFVDKGEDNALPLAEAFAIDRLARAPTSSRHRLLTGQTLASAYHRQQ